MDGWEATRLIRKKESGTGNHVPIIALTAHALKGDRELCIDAGMDGYLAKPVSWTQLFEAIDEATGLLPVTDRHS
jgi:CheY-like chemotaxis protein